MLSYVNQNKEELIAYFEDDFEKNEGYTSEKLLDNLENRSFLNKISLFLNEFSSLPKIIGNCQTVNIYENIIEDLNEITSLSNWIENILQYNPFGELLNMNENNNKIKLTKLLVKLQQISHYYNIFILLKQVNPEYSELKPYFRGVVIIDNIRTQYDVQTKE